MSNSREEIDVIEVARCDMLALAGLPWEQAIDGHDVRRVVYWSRENLQPDHCFLRNIDGRAFLYLQNW